MISSYVLIVGAMKSGTTTLFDALAKHPRIAPCAVKEPGFFAFEEVWAQGFDWYESLFSFDPSVHHYGLDGSTDYSKRPFCDGIANRLGASAPRDFRLIYIMRHPLRRIESHAKHTQYTKREVGRFLSPRADHSLDEGISPVNLTASKYAYQLEPYRLFFDRGQLHLMSLEALQTDYEREIARVLDFLDLSHDADTIKVRHSNDAQDKRQANWLSARIRYSRYLNWLPSGLRLKLAHQLEKKPNLHGRFCMTPEEEKDLAEVFGSSVERLRLEFGFQPPESWRL